MIADDFDATLRDYLIGVLTDVGEIIAAPYRVDRWWFGSTETVDRFREMMPRLTGKEAFKNRRAVGSHHFVYVNRLVFGMLSILTDLKANVNTARARQQLLAVVDSKRRRNLPN